MPFTLVINELYDVCVGLPNGGEAQKIYVGI